MEPTPVEHEGGRRWARAYAGLLAATAGLGEPTPSPDRATPSEVPMRSLRRARDLIDRCFAEELDVPTMAAEAHASTHHFIRAFRAAFGETPGRYLQRRRIERAMDLLRHTDLPVTDVCHQVGFSSLGSFSATFRDIVGSSPSAYRDHPPEAVPACYTMMWTRPAGS